MPNLSTKVDEQTLAKARAAAHRKGKTVSAFVRDAVAKRLEESKPATFGEKYGHLIGCVKGPGDLSKREGFPGKQRHR